MIATRVPRCVPLNLETFTAVKRESPPARRRSLCFTGTSGLAYRRKRGSRSHTNYLIGAKASNDVRPAPMQGAASADTPFQLSL